MKIYQKGAAVVLHVYVQPRASTTEIVGIHGDALKIRIAAPPVDGEANAELERFLAKLLGVARSTVTVTGGTAARQKAVTIEETTAAAVQAAVDHQLKRAK